jgi:hypothetical protein
MTDEEMAEEYADEKCKDCYMCSYSEHKNPYKICQRRKDVKQAYLAGLKAGRPQWHKLSEKYPYADTLVRVRLMSGMEHICETCYYEPTEDEIGYGKLIINFYELNGEWVDDNDVIAWCEIPTYDKEIE